MKLRGTVFSGALRGAPLIEKYYARLIGLIGYRPFFGTLNVKLERNFSLAAYAVKKIDHVMRSGVVNVEAYLALATIRKLPKSYAAMQINDREKTIIDNMKKLRGEAADKLDVKTEEIPQGTECWLIQFTGELHDAGSVEVLAKEQLRKTLGLEDDDAVEITIPDKAPRKAKKKSDNHGKTPAHNILRRRR